MIVAMLPQISFRVEDCANKKQLNVLMLPNI